MCKVFASRLAGSQGDNGGRGGAEERRTRISVIRRQVVGVIAYVPATTGDTRLLLGPASNLSER